jgi:hypothetical protein
MPVVYDSGPLAPVAPAPMQAPAMPAPMAMSASMAARPAHEMFDPAGSFGVTHRTKGGNKKGLLLLAVGGALIAAAAVVAVIVSPGGEQTPTPTAEKPPTTGSAVGTPQTPQTPPADQNTGFDLYVIPGGVTQWKLDGETRTDRLPSRIRGITPGSHSVQIDAPPGFLSQTQKVEVVAGKADRVDIKLEPIQGIQGLFESTPPGATVSLIVDGKRQPLGDSPAKAPLDPRITYQVLFEKAGYVSVNRPVVISGALEERINVVLEKAGTVGTADPPKTDPPRTNPPKTDPPKTNPPKTDPPKIVKTDPPKVDPPKVDPPKVDPPRIGTGTLMLGSKPSCEIYVDGATTGLYTPQPSLKLRAGPHKITLINNEFGIRDSFNVEISPDKPTKMIKDYSDKLPK